MKTVEERADDYAFNNWFGSREAYNGYIQGYADCIADVRPEIKVIERDQNGFATNECLDQIRQALPIMVKSSEEWYTNYEYVDEPSWCVYEGEIERHISYTHYFKCPLINNE